MKRFNRTVGSFSSQQITSSQKESGEGIQFNLPKDQSVGIIKVIGVGGGGCNAVRNMYLEGITNVTYAVCNTDSQHLVRCPVPVKLQLGHDGLGAGGNPDKGREEAELTKDRIRQLLSDGTKMVFVTASMGGGTGTGAGPIVAQVAKEMGILTIGIVTIPFSFEGQQKIMKALRGMEEMRRHVDALLVVQNDKLTGGTFRELPNGEKQRIPMKDQFKTADDILKDAAKSISELITLHTEGDINLDFRDVETTMKNGGDAIMAAGRASGDHRVERAIIQALDSPLLYGNDIGRARRILFDIYTSDEEPLYMDEMHEIDDFMRQLDPDIEVIWGTSTDNTLGKDAKVIILASALAHEMQTDDADPTPAVPDDAHYRALMHQLYDAPKSPVRTLLQQPELPFADDGTTEDGNTELQDDGTAEPLDEKPLEPQDGGTTEQQNDETTDSVNPEIPDSVDPKPIDPPVPPKPTFLQKAWKWLTDLTTENPS